MILLSLTLVACRATNSDQFVEIPDAEAISSRAGVELGARYRVNCSMPNSSSFTSDAGVLKFVLKNGDVGNCPTDKKQFISSDSGYKKEFSERAEIVWERPKFKNGTDYRIQFQHRVLAGYDNGDRNETVFQIKDCRDSRVPVMVFLRRDQVPQKRYAIALAPGTDGKQFLTRSAPTSVMKSDWVDYEVLYSAKSPSSIFVRVDGYTVLPLTKFKNAQECNGAGTLRFGIYRSGAREGNENSMSIGEYRNLRVTQISR